MASSRRTRRRHQQKSLQRHQLRLEGLEKRYALDAGTEVLLLQPDVPDDWGFLTQTAPATLDENIIFSVYQEITHDGTGTPSGRTPGGTELWTTDGSASQTIRLAGRFRESVNWMDSQGIRNLTTFGNQVFFAGEDPVYGDELWVTDGTPEGTRMALDIWPGGGNRWDGRWIPNSSEPKYLTITDGGLFFVADQGNGERVFRYDANTESISPILYEDGSEIVLYSTTNGSNETGGKIHSFVNTYEFGSFDATDAYLNGEILSDGVFLYLFVPTPPPTNGGGMSWGPHYSWIRFNSITGESQAIFDNSLYQNGGGEYPVTRAAIEGSVFFQSSRSVFVLEEDDPSPKKLFDLPPNKNIQQFTEHDDWIYAKTSRFNSLALTEEIIRFQPQSNSYETVWSVVVYEGGYPGDVDYTGEVINRDVDIIGSTSQGFLFVENVRTNTRGTNDEGGFFGGDNSTWRSTETIKSQLADGEIINIKTDDTGIRENSFQSVGVIKYPKPLTPSWQIGGAINGSVFFRQLVLEEMPISGGGMGGMGGGTTAGESPGGVTETQVKEKVFLSDGSVHGTFELISLRRQSYANGTPWPVGAVNDMLLLENAVASTSFSVGIYSVRANGNELPSLNLLEDMSLLENSLEQTIPLTGIRSSGTNQKPLQIVVSSSNTGLIPDPSVTYSSPDTTGNLSFAPAADQFGTATITVTVEDGGIDNNLATSGDNKTFSRSFDITVNSSNQIPTATTLSNWTISETTSIGTLVGTFETTDPDLGDTFSYSLVSGPNAPINENFIISGNALLTNSEFGSSGFQAIRVRSTDQEGRWIENVFGINILEADPPIEPPTLDVLADIAIAEDASQQFISLTGISAGGGMGGGMDGGMGGLATVQLFATSSNTDLVPHPTATLNPWGPSSTGSLTFSPTPDASGTTTITVTVENGQNTSISREFTVTVMPVNDSPTMDELENPVWYGDEFHDKQVTFTVGGITAGGEEHTQPLRVHATSSNPALVTPPASQLLPSPTVFPPEPLLAEVTYVIRAGHSGLSTITVTIEDGGLDNNLSTPDDNESFIRQSNVMVLLLISDPHGETTDRNPKLSRDDYFKIYVDGQPVMLNNEGVPSEFNGFNFIRAESGPANALLLKPSAAQDNRPTHRLLTDETWRINGIFNSLQNASSPVLDLSGREVSGTLNIVAVAGAYEINSVNNPTLIVRRGQAYTFNLNTAGHPFYLQTTGGGYQSANAYSDGFNGNGKTSGEHQWVVPEDTPDEIFYQCEFHPVMFGKIIVVD